MLTLTVLITMFMAAAAVSVGVRVLGVALRACGWLLGVGLMLLVGLVLLPFGIIIALVAGAAALFRLLLPVVLIVILIAMLSPKAA